MPPLPDLADWLVDSNDALTISLVSPSKSGLRLVDTFHPEFTYPIFGEQEKIFGYKDLKISLRYRANDMRPHLGVSYSKKLTPPKGVEEPLEIKSVLQADDHLPKVAFVKSADFESSAQQLADNWTPPGGLHDVFESADGHYEIWKGSLADPAIKQLIDRTQILIPLFIEGGSYITQTLDSDSNETDALDADRWTVFLLYRTQTSPDDPAKKSYVFAGLSTVYRFFYFTSPLKPPEQDDWELPAGDFDLATLPCRTRLSQFLILPPFQRKGNGAKLYKSIFHYYLSHEQTIGITVENPNEVFDDLRDVCDFAFLKTVSDFVDLRLDSSAKILKGGVVPKLIVGQEKLEDIRNKTKIAPRQFSRLTELYLMSRLPPSVRPRVSMDDTPPAATAADKHLLKVWQLIVKQRLLRHNVEALAQFDLVERIEKLNQTLAGVELDYARLLDVFDRNSKHDQVQPDGKRKLDGGGSAAAPKKVRLEEGV